VPFTCCKCPPDRNQHQRGISYLRNGEFTEYCRVHDPANLRALQSARNVFEGLTLEHVKDEQGKKIKVNSIKELRDAEKRYGFVLDCATNDGGDTSKPPQHKPWAGDLTHGYEKKWARDPASYVSPDAKKGVSAGMAANADETLVNRPNPV